MSKPKALKAHIRGKNLDLRAVEDFRRKLTDVTDALARSMDMEPSVRWAIEKITFECDGCGAEKPPDGDEKDWVVSDGSDWCPACIQPNLNMDETA